MGAGFEPTAYLVRQLDARSRGLHSQILGLIDHVMVWTSLMCAFASSALDSLLPTIHVAATVVVKLSRRGLVEIEAISRVPME
jgi:hypothetical protein